MSADFWAGYISGATGIVIGNPLDLIKVRLQAGERIATRPGGFVGQFESVGTLVKGASAPILGYGALNALLFVSYNQTLSLLGEDYSNPSSAWKTWLAGANGGLASWVVSAPTELIKCRVQVSTERKTSFVMAREIVKVNGFRGLYYGGTLTCMRDSIGYGFYFWSYELSKQWMTRKDESPTYAATKVVLCGGLAGIVTWGSVFPFDVIKTRVQTQPHPNFKVVDTTPERGALLNANGSPSGNEFKRHLGAWQISREAYQREGPSVFFRGLGVCSARAFIVNAVQWSVYEWIMHRLKPV